MADAAKNDFLVVRLRGWSTPSSATGVGLTPTKREESIGLLPQVEVGDGETASAEWADVAAIQAAAAIDLRAEAISS